MTLFGLLPDSGDSSYFDIKGFPRLSNYFTNRTVFVREPEDNKPLVYAPDNWLVPSSAVSLAEYATLPLCE